MIFPEPPMTRGTHRQEISFSSLLLILMLLSSLLIPTAVSTDTAETRANGTELAWTGEDGYLLDGLEPDRGLNIDDYEFRVMYFSDNNTDPRVSSNHIDLILDGTHYPMETVDEYFADGSIFSCHVSDMSSDPHSYYFEVIVDGEPPVLTETITGPFVNSNPVLSVPDIFGGAFHETTVYPSIGNTTDIFTFQIVYTDGDNHTPAEDGFSAAVYIDNVYHKMDQTPVREDRAPYYNGNFTDGELFLYSTKLDKGEHEYYFRFTDEMGATVTSTDTLEPFPLINVLTGFPDLLVKTNGKVPDISWELPSSSLTDWNKVKLSAAIENDGGTDITETFLTEIEIYYIDPEDGKAMIEPGFPMAFTPIHGLKEGEEHLLSMDYVPPVMGMYEVRIIIDRDDQGVGAVRELIEYDGDDELSNNIGKVRFKAGPDLAITAMDITPPSAFNGKKIIPSVTIHNSGQTDAKLVVDLEVVFTLGDHGPITVKVPARTTIYAGKTHKVGYARDLSVEKDVEMINISVVVDPNNSLGEAVDHGTFLDNNAAYSTIRIVTRKAEIASPSFGPSILLVFLALFGISLITNRRG